MVSFPLISVPIQRHESVHGRSMQALHVANYVKSFAVNAIINLTRTSVSKPVLLSAPALISKYEIVISNVMIRIYPQTILELTLAHDT